MEQTKAKLDIEMAKRSETICDRKRLLKTAVSQRSSHHNVSGSSTKSFGLSRE